MNTALYRNPRAWRGRVVQVALWVGVIAMATIPLNAPPMTGADMGVFIGGVALMLAAAIAVEVYLRRYVVAIDQAPDGAVFTTLTTFATMRRTHARGEIRYAGRRHDQSNIPGAPSVDNHWVSLHTPAGKFAYLVDVTPPAQIDDKALKQALG